MALTDGFCGAEEIVMPRNDEMSSDTNAASEPLLCDSADESPVFAPVDTFGPAGLAVAKPFVATRGDGTAVALLGSVPVDTTEIANTPKVRH